MPKPTIRELWEAVKAFENRLEEINELHVDSMNFGSDFAEWDCAHFWKKHCLNEIEKRAVAAKVATGNLYNNAYRIAENKVLTIDTLGNWWERYIIETRGPCSSV